MRKDLIFPYEKFHRKTKYQKRIIEKKNFTYRLILETLNPYLVYKQRILDIGCGAGTLSFYLANEGNYVKGMDISKNAIKSCKVTAQFLGLGDKLDFEVKDFTKGKGHEVEKYELILFSEVLEHLRDEEPALTKIFSLLKPGGLVLISVPSENALLYRLGVIGAFEEAVGHLRRYTPRRLLKKIREANFRIIEIKKTEGVFRNILFVSKIGNSINRFANRFSIISDIFTFIDNITLRLFGESQLIVIAQKPEKEKK